MTGANHRRGGHGGASGSTSINQKAALASAYQELGKELSSGKLKAVGNYTLQRPIGEGTYGKVRLGIHRLTNTRVAIKQVPKAHSASLTREIHHHRRLHHPHVMKLYEVLATETYIWMVSELCAGGELYDYLVERGTLPEAEGRRIFGQLCLAVAYIHGKGIVHRDLKLENVLLDERCNVKLGDFGFTREFEGKKLMETYCGTTGYAAPEMLAGKRYTGEEVDIWSLGVILYALLCGALPFDDDDDDVMKAKILKGDYEIPDVLSEEAKDLISSILQQDPLQRPTIKSILAHPWFIKLMVSTPMSTVDEDADYFSSVAEDGDTGNAEGVLPDIGEDLDKPILNVIQQTNEPHIPSPLSTTAFTASDSGRSSTSSSPSSSVDREMAHKQSASGLSESSYYSALSDSESSDRRSNSTDITDPASPEGLPVDLCFNGDAKSKPSAAKAEPQKMSIHRNESQTTIKRTSSNGSESSRGGAKISGRSPSVKLPTHHESPGSSETDTDDVPIASSIPNIVKRGSQGSSMGHHRTPSRTKRRSLSSSGLSDHHPPQIGSKPIDYVALLTQLQPAAFSTALEQNLLHQLSALGIDVGQMVHSIVTDACDASGAMWWMLVRKAQEKDPASVPSSSFQTLPAAPSSPNRANVPPPPLPPKDPNRKSEGPALIESSQSTPRKNEADKGKVARSQSLDQLSAYAAESVGQSVAARLAEAPTSASLDSLQVDRVPISSSDSTTPKPSKPRQTENGSPLTRQESSLISASDSPQGKRRPAHTDRARSNSLSMKQIASSVLGGHRDKDKNQPEQVCVAGENLPFERARSPGSSIFGKRTTNYAKEGTSGSDSQPSTPKKSAVDTEKDRSRKVMAKKSIENDLDRVRAMESGKSSPSRSSGADDTSKATPSASVDSFSTLSLTPQTSEKGNGKSRSGSSFMATVRTWLGSNEKQSRKSKNSSKKGTKISASGLGRDGPGSNSQAVAWNNSVRNRSGQYSSAAANRRSPLNPIHGHGGSSSRRSSTGSAYRFEGPAPAHLHQPSRSSNLRRQSAGSITPTGTLYADYTFDNSVGLGSSRSSRPSSSHSQQQFHGLHGKSGSVSSTSSILRNQGYAGSTRRSIHGRRPSHDGGTTVRRHRAYGSISGESPSRSGSLRRSRPGSLHSRSSSMGRSDVGGRIPEAEEIFDESGNQLPRSGISTPRRSTDSRPGSSGLRNETGRASPCASLKADVHTHSIFVAHKSRSPYKPPSANPSLHGVLTRGSPHMPSSPALVNSSGSSTAGTWRRSWGRPPPSWTGLIDPPKSADGAGGKDDSRQKLRDVFASKEREDDWIDEDDEPSYSGGLGQLDSLSGASWDAGSYGGDSNRARGSPYSTAKSFAAREGLTGNSVSSGNGGGLFGSGRYAGVRSLFQPPALGNEFSPKLISSVFTSNGGNEKAPGGVSAVEAERGGAVTTTSPSLTQEGMPNNIGGMSSSRIRTGSAAPAFKGNIIEEEEEDE
ncbi:Pkinase-domain-containing protein [Violaceomyces palustris]|uniref:Pkinase-domain-containing protein n=1 Tax=Violaceomyces palustris TaxID=1673888 RepID=A0ACD0P6A9_9BASI|nr:Pkinase-domain-containing protein [Violaceomyces palustris]